eukprot:m51a1_g8986 putative cysteine proteinase rd19a (577) ;mRNA; f:60367-62554
MARIRVVTAVAVAMACGVLSAVVEPITPLRPVVVAFNSFKVNFNKVYATPEEGTCSPSLSPLPVSESFRLSVFANTLAQIDRLHLEQTEATFAVNQFSDMTDEEFEQRYLSGLTEPTGGNDTAPFFDPVIPFKDDGVAEPVLRPVIPRIRPVLPPLDPIAIDVDLPDGGRINPAAAAAAPRALPASYRSPYVTPVKSQGGCGSCWAFAAGALVEHAWNKANGRNVSVSEQQMLECTDGDCSGGWPEDALDYVLGVSRVGGGLMPDRDYPYTAVDDGTCNARGYRAAASIADFGHVDGEEWADMPQALVTHGSLAVTLNAKLLKSYHSGVVRPSDACDHKVNHAVTITGYTPDAWIVKNSWGSWWGESGYFRIKRGQNACRIADHGAWWARSSRCTASSGFACAYGTEFGNDGSWGTWGPLAACPTGTFATGIATKSEDGQGIGDDTALNGLRLLCGPSFAPGPTSLVAPWGTWDSAFACPAGYFLTDFAIMVEAPVGWGDDTAANRVRARCRKPDGSLYPLVGQPNSKTSWGSWSGWYMCPSGWAVVGLRTRVEASQGAGDDTALNAVRMRCKKIA